MRWVSLLVIACAACGGQASSPPDAAPAVVDAYAGHAALVHATFSGPVAGTSTLVTPPFTEGDMLLVIVALPEGGTFSKIVRAGNSDVNSWLINTPGATCMAETETWLSSPSPISAGASSVTVERDDDKPFSIAAYELSGVTLTTTGSGRLPGMAPGSAPPLDAEAGQLVFSSITTCGTVTGLAPTSPFIALDTNDDGTSSAFLVPTVTGTYAGAWSYPGTSWDANTIVFR